MDTRRATEAAQALLTGRRGARTERKAWRDRIRHRSRKLVRNAGEELAQESSRVLPQVLKCPSAPASKVHGPGFSFVCNLQLRGAIDIVNACASHDLPEDIPVPNVIVAIVRSGLMQRIWIDTRCAHLKKS